MFLQKGFSFQISSIIINRREKENFFQLLSFVSKNKEFITFSIKRLIFTIGLTMVIPLLPIFFVRTIDASDKWIGIFTTVKTAVMFLGYFFWTNQSHKKGVKICFIMHHPGSGSLSCPDHINRKFLPGGAFCRALWYLPIRS